MTDILIVDDSPFARKLAGSCVEKAGLTPAFAENGRDALEVMERQEPDIVLTDLQMPEMDGLELVERVRRQHPSVPVILMTAHGSEDTAAAALKAGAASYVPKQNLERGVSEALRVVMAAVEARQYRERVQELLAHTESHFVLGSDTEAATALVSYLQNEMEKFNFWDEVILFQITTALTEAITNAVDHGNLELNSVLREGDDDAYYRLRRERSAQAPFCDRRAYVAAKFTPQAVTFSIRDEGPGFDPATLPDAQDAENLLKVSGRGVMLIRTFMDEVSFNTTGNEIVMVKRRAAAAAHGPSSPSALGDA